MKEIFRLCLVLTLLTAISAGVLAYVSKKTAGPIAKALLEERMSAVRNVLPPFDNNPDKDKFVAKKSDGTDVVVYEGMKDGKVVGVAFAVVSHNGYSGDIEFMLGVNMDGIIQGIVILKQLETPGLGAKIQNSDFRDQYKGKSLENPQNWAVTKDGGTFVPITGATISSRAITAATVEGLRFFETIKGEIAVNNGGALTPGSEKKAGDTAGEEGVDR